MCRIGSLSGEEPLRKEQSDYKLAQSGIKEMHTTTQRAQNEMTGRKMGLVKSNGASGF